MPKEGRGKTRPKYYGRGSATLAEGKFIVQGETGVLALVELNPESSSRFRESTIPRRDILMGGAGSGPQTPVPERGSRKGMTVSDGTSMNTIYCASTWQYLDVHPCGQTSTMPINAISRRGVHDPVFDDPATLCGK